MVWLSQTCLTVLPPTKDCRILADNSPSWIGAKEEKRARFSGHKTKLGEYVMYNKHYPLKRIGRYMIRTAIEHTH